MFKEFLLFTDQNEKAAKLPEIILESFGSIHLNASCKGYKNYLYCNLLLI